MGKGTLVREVKGTGVQKETAKPGGGGAPADKQLRVHRQGTPSAQLPEKNSALPSRHCLLWTRGKGAEATGMGPHNP